MTEVDSDWVEETFQDRVEGEDDVTLEDVEEWYADKLEEYDDEKLARITVQAEFNSWVNAGADGEVDMVTIGARDDPFNNGDVFMGYAIAIPEDRPVRPAVVEFRRDTIDPDPFLEYFYEPYTPIRGEFDFRDAPAPVGSKAYRMEAVETTEIEEFEAERDLEGRKELVKDIIPKAEIANIGDYLSLTNDDGWAASFGVDMRLIEDAYVHEVRVGENAARLVIQDDSFVDARDLDKTVRGEDEEAGLAGFGDTEMIDFGEGSIADIYCSVTPDDDGQVTMGVIGTDPASATELNTGGGDDSGSSASEEDVGGGAGAEEERTI